MAISVQFEIGHTAKLRAKKTPEGFTHDWDLYVRGSNKSDISAYVDKVVFNLHESFQRPKRVIKEPPYVIHESGYASFILNIDIYFRSRDEPKRVQYTYDLDLQQNGPPHHRSEEKKFLFENPSEEFRQKLLKGGGVPVVPAGLTGSRSLNANIMPSSFNDSNNTISVNKHKSSNSNSESGSSNKKHKSRTDDSKLNTFANLFGTPETSGKSSSTIPSKSNSDALKFGSAGKVSSPSTASVSSTNSIVKEKSSKEGKEKSSSSTEKSKEKSERKEKHKSVSNLSPIKESKKIPIETGKFEKRSEDKPKKDKSRDKERERSRNDQSLTSTPNSLGAKPSSSSKSVTSTPVSTQSVGSTSASNAVTQRIINQISALPTNRSDEKVAIAKLEKIEKSEKETKDKHSSSSSSGKKSKKEKKDKDKDKEKERDKEKRSSGDSKSKESHLSALQAATASNSPSGSGTPNTQTSSTQQSKTFITNSKKNEKELKQESFKSKLAHSNDKTLEKQAIATSAASTNAAAILSDKKASIAANGSASNSSSNTATKTHKHKKKDKSKDKDKDKEKDKEKERISFSGIEKDKEKSKDKHKEKLEEKRETEKPLEVASTKSISPEFKKTASNLLPPATTVQQSNSISNNSTNESPIVSSKKSQNKDKKSRDSKSSKESKKRSSDNSNITTIEPKSKATKTSTPLSTAGSNIELSDADSRQSNHDHSLKVPSATPSSTTISTEAPDVLSDSSYCSFPDVTVKQNEKPVPPPNNASPEKSVNNRNSTSGSKENKQKEKDKSFNKQLSDKASSKAEKEEKKRRRSTVNVTPENTTTTFVEPPLKQTKKEQSKTQTNATTPTTTNRDSTKSPLPRNNTSIGVNVAANVVSNTKTKNQPDANNQEVDSGTSIILTSSPNANINAHAPNLTSNHTTNNIVNNSTPQQQEQRQRVTPLPASPALNNDTIWPNLSELQELHRKIMTLQDNDELQQVVELIAASGCYELTQRTFDFDLCKLDRSTVERLQEFFATSVS